MNENEFIQKLFSAGVAVTPGSLFFPYEPQKVHFRLSIAHRKDDEIREGIKRIGMFVNSINQKL
jgi:DNA-binding transcriptional MocR family regulator